MQFLINDREIKTIISGAKIKGSLYDVSRIASFSYVYCPNDTNFATYKAKAGQNVVIKNDDGDNIFKGAICDIDYKTDKHLIEIKAQDYLSILLNTVAQGRFKGTLTSILTNALNGYDLTFGLDSILMQEVNILSLGSISLYDVISIAVNKLYGDDFKIYLDGNAKLKILLPLISNSKGNFVIGENIISSSFEAKIDENRGRIRAIGSDDVVSGSIIKVIDSSSGLNSYFTVINDCHIYTNTHTMELELKERIFN